MKAIKCNGTKERIKEFRRYLNNNKIPYKERIDALWDKEYDYLRHFLRLTLDEKIDFYDLFKMDKKLRKEYRQYKREQRKAKKSS